MRRIIPALLLGASLGYATEDELKSSSTPPSSTHSLTRMDDKEMDEEADDPYANCSQHINYLVKAEHEKSLKEGRQEGRQEEKLTTALKMLQKRMPDEQILDLTEISKEQLDQLKEEIAKKQQTQHQ